MNELKQALAGDLYHVKTVYFDADGNWYLHKNAVCVREMSRDEILGNSEAPESPEEPTERTNRKRK